MYFFTTAMENAYSIDFKGVQAACHWLSILCSSQGAPATFRQVASLLWSHLPTPSYKGMVLASPQAFPTLPALPLLLPRAQGSPAVPRPSHTPRLPPPGLPSLCSHGRAGSASRSGSTVTLSGSVHTYICTHIHLAEKAQRGEI